MASYCVVLGLIAGWGFLVLDIGPIFGDSLSNGLVGILVGGIAGVLAVWSDRIIVRYLARRSLFTRSRTQKTLAPPARYLPREPNVVVRSRYAIDGARVRRSPGGIASKQKDMGRALAEQRFGIPTLVVAAVLEELIYRGFLVRSCFLLPSGVLTGLTLLGSVLIFALAHIRFGWAHVLAKAPLGALALATVLGLGALLPAIIAHVVFNIAFWRDLQHHPVVLPRTKDPAVFPGQRPSR